MMQKIITVIVGLIVLIGFGMLLIKDKHNCENSCGGTCYSNCSDEFNFVCINNSAKCSYLSINDTIKYFNKPKIDLNIDKIYMTRDVLNIINNAYAKTQKETFFCLNGDKYKDSYIINDVYTPPINESSDISITPSYGCLGNAFGYIHSHPNGICMPSNESNNELGNSNGGDIAGWTKDNRSIYGIMCGNDKINIYKKGYFTYNDFISVISVDNYFESNITLNVGSDLCDKKQYYCGGDCYNMNSTKSYTCIDNRMSCIRECSGICYNECTKGVFECVNGVGKCKI